MPTFTFSQLIGGVSLLLILAVLSFAAVGQANHDALIALTSLVSGAGIGAVATTALKSAAE